MIHAYDEIYLGKAQMTLAWMFDYAVNGCRIDVEEFYRMFLTSAYVHRFEKGNCSVVAGLSGVELAQRVIWERTPDKELRLRAARNTGLDIHLHIINGTITWNLNRLQIRLQLQIFC